MRLFAPQSSKTAFPVNAAPARLIATLILGISTWCVAAQDRIEPPRRDYLPSGSGEHGGARPPMPRPEGGPSDPRADGPWNRDVIVYRAGPDGKVERADTFERAGVPTIARLKGDRIIVAHQHFPENDVANFDKVAARISEDDGKSWGAPRVIRVDALPEGMRFPFDPTLVPLPDGRVRLYFTGNMGRDARGGVPAIHSAISEDGINYAYEPDVRFAVEGRQVIDCAVVLHRGVFHLYAPHTGARAPGQRPGEEAPEDRPRPGVGYHATSEDGLNFTRQPDVQIEGRRRWLGNAQSDGRHITFFGTADGPPSAGPGAPPRAGLWMATSPDGQNWKSMASPPIRGADPGAVATRDGGLLVVITSEPVRRVAPPRGAGDPAAQPPRDAGTPGGHARTPPRSPQDMNRPLDGTEADARHYAKVNADSEFTPRRGGVAAPGGPAPMRLMIATSADGLRFQRRNLIVTDQASVPDLVVDRNGWIWLYYQSASVGEDVNRVALAVSRDAGASWTFRRVVIEGFGSPKPDPCDPEIQLLEDGTFRLFLTWSERGGRPCTWLADGHDGVNFRLVGKAFEPPGEALDPSVVRIGRTWHIFAGGGRGPGENWHGTSRDGRLFTADAPMQLATDGTNCMMANGLTESGGARFYAFNNAGLGRPHRIYSFFTRNGTEWAAEPGVRLDADGLPALEMEGFGVLDPAVGRLKDGSHLMIYTTRIPGTQRQDRGPGPPPGPPGVARPE